MPGSSTAFLTWRVKIYTQKILKVSAKNNIGIEEIFTILEKEGKPPQIFDSSPLALIIDSWYDNYSGMVLLVRNFGSTIQNNVNYQTDKLKKINIKKMGYFIPEKLYTQEIESGSIGFLQIGVKNIESIKICTTTGVVCTSSIRSMRRKHCKSVVCKNRKFSSVTKKSCLYQVPATCTQCLTIAVPKDSRIWYAFLLEPELVGILSNVRHPKRSSINRKRE